MDLLLADDLTGCCDTGIKFVQAGLPVTLAINPAALSGLPASESMLAVNADTRVLQPEASSKVTTEICARIEKKSGARPRILYKKLDSTLRGNPGAEIAAIADFWAYDQVFIAVASPKLGRVVTRGVLEIDGVPLAQTVFGRDPGSPMRESEVGAILGGHLPGAVSVRKPDNYPEFFQRIQNARAEGARYLIFDAVTQRELETIAEVALQIMPAPLLAGSSGFAQALCHILRGAAAQASLAKVETMLFVCGSANRSTHAQVEYFQSAGYPVLRVRGDMPDSGHGEMSRKVAELLGKGPVCLAVTEDRLPLDMALRQQTAIADIALRSLAMPGLPTFGLYMTGGETAYSILKEIASCMTLRRELFDGVVFGELADGLYKGLPVITKAGGFGNKEIMLEIYWLLSGKSGNLDARPQH